MKRPETIIKKLKEIKGLSITNKYNGSNIGLWIYYYSLTGYINDVYFNIHIQKHKSDKIDTVLISLNKECRKEIKNILLKIEPKLKII